MGKSTSIPIARSTNYSKEDAERYQERMIADYKDYIFFSRLVDGMQRRQGNTKDKELRYQNQALIDHIISTRHGKDAPRMPHTSSLRECGTHHYNRTQSTADLVSTVSEAVKLANDALSLLEEEEDLIFDLEI